MLNDLNRERFKVDFKIKGNKTLVPFNVPKMIRREKEAQEYG